METTSDIDITDQDMMAFARAIALPRRKPGEMTVKIFAETAGVTRRWALETLTKMESMGLVRSKWVYENQRKAKAFVPIEGTWKDLIEKV